MADRVRAVVLVEGVSDRAAVEALAWRRGRDLPAEGVAVDALVDALDLSFVRPSLDRVLAGVAALATGDERGERRGPRQQILQTPL